MATRKCTEYGCVNAVHAKGLCQPHYRKSKRRERGLRKPGPAPDASKPKSRHNPSSVHHAVAERAAPPVKVTLAVGSTCKGGHVITPSMLKVSSDGKTRCKWCVKNARRAKSGLPPAEVFVDDRANPTPITHCKHGHEFTEENTSTTFGPEGRPRRRCLACSRVSWLRKYGLTPETHQELLDSQGNSCALCRTPFDAAKPHIDHCHETGAVRGILCPGCNTGLGLLGDTPESLQRAAEYVTP